MAFSVKWLNNWEYWYGFSPVCIGREISKLIFLRNDRSHWLHIYGFSLVCIDKRDFKSLFLLKALSQSLQWYGSPPLCIIMCVCKSQFLLKATSQSLPRLHWYFFPSMHNHIYFSNDHLYSMNYHTVAVIWPFISMHQNAAFGVNFITLATLILFFQRMNNWTIIVGKSFLW